MTGGTSGSFAALSSGQVAGAVLTPPYDDKAVTKGFKKFMLIGDLLDIPTSGLMASRAEVTNHRDRVQKTIGALFEAIAWIRANRTDTGAMIADKFKITPNEANGAYETLLSMFNKDGRLPAKVVRGYLDLLRQERPLAARPRPAEVPRFFHVAREIMSAIYLRPTSSTTTVAFGETLVRGRSAKSLISRKTCADYRPGSCGPRTRGFRPFPRAAR